MSREIGDECPISVRFRSTQLVVEVNYGEDDSKLETQLQHQSQQRNRIASC